MHPPLPPAEPLLSWPDFVRRWAGRLERWGGVGEPGPLLDAFLGPEADPALRALAQRALGGLDGGPPGPPPAAWPAPEGPDASRPQSELQHRLGLQERLAALDPGPPALGTGGRTWLLADLALLGERLNTLDRAGWGLPPEPPDPPLQAAWRGWFAGAPWDHRSLWEERCLGGALGTLTALAEDRRLPQRVLRRAQTDLRDGFFLVLCGDREGLPPWLDVALMVLERAEAGPVHALGALLSPEAWVQARGCLQHRGAWRETLAPLGTLWPGPRAGAELEALFGLHGLLQVLGQARRGPGLRLEGATRSLRALRGKLRGRLRALAAEGDRARLQEALLQHPALAEATRQAMAHFWWRRLWLELRRDFSFGADTQVTPPCRPAPSAPPTLAPLPPGPLRAWVLLVLLRGRYGHLERWLRTGSTQDRDSTWGRLLADHLPPTLATGPHGARDLAALRGRLGPALEELVAGLLPTLLDLAALPEDDTLPGAFRQALLPAWDPALPLPERGARAMRAEVIAFLDGRPVMEDEPWFTREPST